MKAPSPQTANLGYSTQWKGEESRTIIWKHIILQVLTIKMRTKEAFWKVEIKGTIGRGAKAPSI